MFGIFGVILRRKYSFNLLLWLKQVEAEVLQFALDTLKNELAVKRGAWITIRSYPILLFLGAAAFTSWNFFGITLYSVLRDMPLQLVLHKFATGPYYVIMSFLLLLAAPFFLIACLLPWMIGWFVVRTLPFIVKSTSAASSLNALLFGIIMAWVAWLTFEREGISQALLYFFTTIVWCLFTSRSSFLTIYISGIDEDSALITKAKIYVYQELTNML